MTKLFLSASIAALTLAACGETADESATTTATDTTATDTTMAADTTGMDADMAAGDPAMGGVTTDPVATGTTGDAMAPDAMMPSTAQDYATQAAAVDMFEIESAQLAMTKSKNADVRQFAQMLVNEHRKSTADLKAAAATAQPPISVSAALTPEQRSNMQSLQSSAEAGFDRLFLTQQIAGHERVLAMKQAYAKSGDVDALKRHASTTAAAVEKHLNRARELANAA